MTEPDPEALRSFLKVRRVRQLLRARTVRFVPPPDPQAVADLANRCAWYLRDTGAAVELPDSPETPETQARYPRHGVAFGASPRRTRRATALWRLGWEDLRRHRGRNAYVVDPRFHLFTESYEWLELRHALLPRRLRKSYEAGSARNFERLVREKSGREEAFVFTTGPSLAKAMGRDYPKDALRIICNSIVKDQALLAHVDPDLLCFSDYVFHFGPSSYAHEFRVGFQRTMADYPECFAILPMHCLDLFIAHFPEFRDRMVGLRFEEGGPWRKPTPAHPSVRTTGNVLTQLMLPIAATLSRKASVLGADGRAPGETYFWKHATRGQFGDLMWTVQECHPSFFEHNNYQAYYEKHCADVEGIVGWMEAQGMKVRSITRSMTPALHAREDQVLE